MMIAAPAAPDLTLVFVELGAATLGLAILARVANRFGVSAIPLYLLAGLAFGNGGLMPLPFSHSFIQVGGEIGVMLLLFTLGLEYTGRELLQSLRSGVGTGVLDLVLNFSPGVAFGLLMHFTVPVSLAFGGITYVSSSGIVARILAESGRQSGEEGKTIVSILVFEDLAMALYLPLITVALAGNGGGPLAIGIALAVVASVLFIAVRFGDGLSRLFAHNSDEVILLTAFGSVLLVAGVAQRLQVSAAVGAFLVGIALSGSVARHAHRVIAPVRDLFAAVFFLFFGLELAPAQLIPVLPAAAALALVTVLSKLATGWWSGGGGELDRGQRLRIGATLIARGEFSIVIAGLAVVGGAPPRVASVAAAYVLLTAIAGPLAARIADHITSPSTPPI